MQNTSVYEIQDTMEQEWKMEIPMCEAIESHMRHRTCFTHILQETHQTSRETWFHYDMCTFNKMVNGQQITVQFHLYLNRIIPVPHSWKGTVGNQVVDALNTLTYDTSMSPTKLIQRMLQVL